MLDKNPEMIFNNIQKEFKKNVPNLILCSDSFHKIEFLNKNKDKLPEKIISQANPWHL